MAKNPDLLQKTYYLHKELDKDLIKFISNSRNASDLIRNALIRELRIQQGEIALIDIKNRQIIGDITLPSPIATISNNDSESEIKEKQNNIDDESIANQDDMIDFLRTCKIV